MPVAAVIASSPELDGIVARSIAAQSLAQIDRLGPFEYSRSLDRVASLGHWLHALRLAEPQTGLGVPHGRDQRETVEATLPPAQA